jgi:hypothetical protein
MMTDPILLFTSGQVLDEELGVVKSLLSLGAVAEWCICDIAVVLEAGR